jgi:hypothetical protein
MTNNLCDFCNRSLATPTALRRHQNTSKKCLKIQGKTIENVHKCRSCGRGFPRSDTRNEHEFTCKAEAKNEELISRITTLENEVRGLSNEPKIVNNHYSTHCIIREFLRERPALTASAFVRNATTDELIQGGASVGNYMGEMLADRVMLINPKTDLVVYRNEHGQPVRDNYMRKLIGYTSEKLWNQGAGDVLKNESHRLQTTTEDLNQAIILCTDQLAMRSVLHNAMQDKKVPRKVPGRHLRDIRAAALRHFETPNTYRLKMTSWASPTSQNQTPPEDGLRVEEVITVPLLAVPEDVPDQEVIFSSDEEEETMSEFSYRVSPVKSNTIRRRNFDESEHDIATIIGIMNYESSRDNGRKDIDNPNISFKYLSKYADQ